MKVPRFLGLTALGSAAWISVLVGLGDAAGRNWSHTEKYFHYTEYPLAAIVVLLLVGGYVHRWRAVRRESAHQAL